MIRLTHSLAVVSLLSVLANHCNAHFKLLAPKARGFDENTLINYPCGGQNTPSATRTMFPMSGAPVQLFLEHIDTKFEVLLALGNNPSGDDFTHIIVPTFQEIGPQDFCLGSVNISAAMGSAARAGMNATMLVMSSGDVGPDSGLYNCADITLAATASAYSPHCHTSTGVQVMRVTGSEAKLNANGTPVASGDKIPSVGLPSIGGTGTSMSAGGGSAGVALAVPMSALSLVAAGVVAAALGGDVF